MATVAPATAPPVPGLPELLAPSPGSLMRRRLLGHWGILLGGGVLLLIVVVALLAPLIAPYDPLAQNLDVRMIPPVWHEQGTWDHPLGTDQFGRDYLSRL
jgi:peptide/nickel transport system permease protein